MVASIFGRWTVLTVVDTIWHKQSVNLQITTAQRWFQTRLIRCNGSGVFFLPNRFSVSQYVALFVVRSHNLLRYAARCQ